MSQKNESLRPNKSYLMVLRNRPRDRAFQSHCAVCPKRESQLVRGTTALWCRFSVMPLRERDEQQR
jgi:hypothetical protein